MKATRRQALGIFLGLIGERALAGLSFSSVGGDRVVVVSSRFCGPCVRLKPKLESVYRILRNAGWRIGRRGTDHFQTLDYEQDREWIDQHLPDITLPFLGKLEGGKVVRKLDHIKQPIDQWSLGWLYKGQDERRSKTAGRVGAVESNAMRRYPTRPASTWWSIAGRRNVSRSAVLQHLLTHHPQLRGYPLVRMSRSELHSLHSDDHDGKLRSWTVYRRSQAAAG